MILIRTKSLHDGWLWDIELFQVVYVMLPLSLFSKGQNETSSDLIKIIGEINDKHKEKRIHADKKISK